MRIAYVIHWDVSRRDGVTGKVADHLRYWANAGHAVKLFVVNRDPHVGPALAGFDVETIDASRLDRILRTAALSTLVSSYKPDLIYHRFVTYYPYLARLARRHPMVLEVNSLDEPEYRVAHGRLARTYHRLTRAALLRHCAGFVCLTDEIAASMAPFGKPMTTVANGVDLERFTALPARPSESARLVLLASPNCWHGVDKIAALARRSPTWRFDLIGYRTDDVDADLPPNVHCHGFLDESSYQALLEQADVAIAPLALHRKHMKEACSLKVREYLARGLPIIIGGRDSDFPESVPFMLELPNTADNVETNHDAIERFVDSWKGRRVPRAAIEHLDHAAKERERLSFFQGVAAIAPTGKA